MVTKRSRERTRQTIQQRFDELGKQRDEVQICLDGERVLTTNLRAQVTYLREKNHVDMNDLVNRLEAQRQRAIEAEKSMKVLAMEQSSDRSAIGSLQRSNLQLRRLVRALSVQLAVEMEGQ